MSIDPTLQAILDQSSEQNKLWLETLQQLTNENIGMQKKIFLTQTAQMEINGKAVDAFTNAGDHLLRIQALVNRDREKLMGASDESYDMVNSYTPAQQVIDNAPSVGGNNYAMPWQMANDKADFWANIVDRIDNFGVAINELPNEIVVNGHTFDVREKLAGIGIDKNNPKPGDVNAIHQEATDAAAKAEDAALIEEFYNKDEVTDEDVANFLYALGELAEDFRAVVEEFVAAKKDYDKIEEVLPTIELWKTRHADWVEEYDTNHDGVVDSDEDPGLVDPEPMLSDYLTLGDKIWLEAVAGGDLDSLTPEQVDDLIEGIRDRYEAAQEALANRPIDPVSGDDATDPEAWEELMGTESATMLSEEEEEDLDVGPLP